MVMYCVLNIAFSYILFSPRVTDAQLSIPLAAGEINIQINK